MGSRINWYLTSMGDSATLNPIPITEDVVVGIYRRDDDSDNIYARAGGEPVELGIRDGSVSRMRAEGAPIRLSRDGEAVRVHNIDNASPLTIMSPGSHREQRLESGEQTQVDRDCTVGIGYTAKLVLSRELDRTAEQGETVGKRGMSVTAYVPVHCKTLRILGDKKTRSDVQSCAENLLDVLHDHPRDVTGYQKRRDELADFVEQVEVVGRTTDSESIPEDKHDELVEITEKIEGVYRRKP
jgi:hypothetical protein